jgi:hypothetical protein
VNGSRVTQRELLLCLESPILAPHSANLPIRPDGAQSTLPTAVNGYCEASLQFIYSTAQELLVEIKPERSSYTPNDLISFRESGSLELTARFQRREVWKTPAKSFFIDTLLRGYPVPPIYIRVTQDKDHTRTVREVIDGQQRLRAVLDFIDNKYALTNAAGPELSGRIFEELDTPQRNVIREFPFIFEVLHGISDQRVLEIFSRLNTYSVPLNGQELRNGTYFGLFKQACYGLAFEHIEFWRTNRILSDARIARMLEVELASELLILQMAGLQDKKKSINRFYAEYDTSFSHRRQLEDQFRAVIDEIVQSLGETLSQSEFRRPPLFYSLFATVCQIRFGIPGIEPTANRRRGLSQQDRRRLRSAVARLSEIISLAKAEEAVPRKYERFVAASLRQTDNILPRQVRTNALLSAAFD